MLRKLLVGLLLAVNMFAACAVFMPQPAHAASAAYCRRDSAAIPLLPPWYKYLNPHFADGECVLDAGFPESIPAILLAIFEIILRLTGLVAVLFIIYGGFQYLTTAGEPDKAKNARTTIINALVGLVIAMLSTVIVNLVGGNI